MKRVLITGGCGFIGSSLALDLMADGYDVTVLDNLHRHGADILLERVLAHGGHYIRGDVREASVFEAIQEDFSAVVLASAEASAFAGMDDPGQARGMLDVNLGGTINCLEWARRRKVPILFLSSSRVYPYDKINACAYREDPTRFSLANGCCGVGEKGVRVDMPLEGVRSLYGASKLAAEFIVKEYAVQYGLPALMNRCGVVSGPWQLGKAEQGVFAFWLASHYFKRPLRYTGFGGNGKQVRDILHIQDLCRLFKRQLSWLIEEPVKCQGQVYNVGGGVMRSVSLRELTDLSQRLTGHDINIESLAYDRPGDMIWYVTDNGVVEEAFDWRPELSVEDVFADIYQWLKGYEVVCRKIFL